MRKLTSADIDKMTLAEWDKALLRAGAERERRRIRRALRGTVAFLAGWNSQTTTGFEMWREFDKAIDAATKAPKKSRRK